MTLAQRVRDFRYAKGWGPDELASRAEISRTALYQIESGKTEQPRAGTLRRIAEALSIPTESLLGQTTPAMGTVNVPWSEPFDFNASAARAAESRELLSDTVRMPATYVRTGWSSTAMRERELERKFRELLSSPLGESVARIVEESYRLLPDRVEAIR